MILYEPFETSERSQAFRKLVEVAKSGGSLVYAQISHPGRQVQDTMNPHPVSASNVQLISKFPGYSHGPPTALTKEGIKDVIKQVCYFSFKSVAEFLNVLCSTFYNQYAYAAHAAYRVGFDGVQLHGAHGYLIAQFLSQTTNKRTDEYGGSLQSRARLLYEIIEAVKAKVADPKFSVAVKLNSVEFQEGGFTPEECAPVCKHLEQLSVDWIELSGGTLEAMAFTHQKESTKKREGIYQIFTKFSSPT